MLQKKAPIISSLEALESRIAPAVVFLAGTDAYRNGMSVLVPDNAAQYGVDAALLLQAGDSLVVDVNHDGVFKAEDDLLLAKVSKGRALLYFDDRDGVAGFSGNEISGALLSDGFVGEINGDVHGSVVAGLRTQGEVGWDSIPSTISGLTVSGTVFGDIFADGAVKNVTIKSAGNDSFPSVQGIWSGSSAGGLFTFGGITEVYVSSATAKSASDIVNVSLARGTNSIISGFGLNGGNISGVTIGHQVTSLLLRAGDSVESSGGRGGSVHDVEIYGANNDLNFTIQAGWGSMFQSESGRMGRKVQSGAGGSIDSVSILAEGARLGTVEITAGDGGSSSVNEGTTFANGADGGDVRGIKLIADSAASTTFLSGNGGQASVYHQAAVTETRDKIVRQRDVFGNVLIEIIQVEVVIRPEILRAGHGGNGGAIEDVLVRAQTALEMRAGQGGQSEFRTAGDAGSIHNVETHGLLSANVYGGLAGIGLIGGNGGSITGFSAASLAEEAAIRLEAGESGTGMIRGGQAGDISRIAISSQHRIGQIDIAAGRGVTATEYHSDSIANGTDGGSISGVHVDVASVSEVRIAAGMGGSGGFRATEIGDPEFGRVLRKGGAGGHGGSVQEVSVHAEEYVGNLFIGSGAGGDGSLGKGAGAGGNISRVSVSKVFEGEIQSGAGGVSTAGRSGNGGNLSNLSVSSNYIESSFAIRAGDGGNGGEEGGTGGNGGRVAHVKGHDISNGFFAISAGSGGNGSEYMVEPRFVEIQKTRLVPDGFGGWELEFVTKTIKVANRIARAGAGGDGGSVSDVKWDAVAGETSSLEIYSGIGGDGASVSAEFERAIKVPDGLGGYYEDFETYTKVFARKAAGSGGNVRDVSVSSDQMTQLSFAVDAGKGGNGNNFALPARGGAISGIHINSLGSISEFSLRGGTGGDASYSNHQGVGSAGGSIWNIRVTANEFLGNTAIWGGDGGNGPKREGKGGSLANIILTAPSEFNFSFVPGSGAPAGTLKNVFPGG